MDADYCAQIIKVVHLQGTPGFPTLYVYDKVCYIYLLACLEWLLTCAVMKLLDNHVKAVIFSCSEFEARNYGKPSSPWFITMPANQQYQVVSCTVSLLIY